MLTGVGKLARIRVENQQSISTTSYRAALEDSGGGALAAVRPFTVLFIKPFQKVRSNTYGPPLGILTLIAGLREFFGDRVTIHFWDMNVYNLEPDALRDRVADYAPDVVGVSALNQEAAASYRIAEIAREWNSEVVTAIGGPLALHQARVVLDNSRFDWVFEGAADRTFLQALARRFSGQPLGTDIPGFSYRDKDGRFFHHPGQDLIKDMDSIPILAWDMLDFDRYREHDRSRIFFAGNDNRYAYLFTSRGCPYLCNYCHDIFTKRFVYRSDEHVLEEIRLLYEEYGVRDFYIIDDIFNLHKPRAQSLMKRIAERWPGELRLAFPNGLRGDILDAETIRAMVNAGTYHAMISIETVTPRLQELVEKYLDIEKAMWAIDEFARHGVIVQGSFMLGFPTETPEEINATIRYATRSGLTHAHFFSVIPQPQTPIFELAASEAPQAALETARGEQGDHGYDSERPWYSRAYGYDLEKRISRAYLLFYIYPPRLFRIVRLYSFKRIMKGVSFIIRRITRKPFKVLVSRSRRQSVTSADC